MKSGASKISIPITNEAGLAQISYAATYPGLTKAIEGLTIHAVERIEQAVDIVRGL